MKCFQYKTLDEARDAATRYYDANYRRDEGAGVTAVHTIKNSHTSYDSQQQEDHILGAIELVGGKVDNIDTNLQNVQQDVARVDKDVQQLKTGYEDLQRQVHQLQSSPHYNFPHQPRYTTRPPVHQIRAQPNTFPWATRPPVQICFTCRQPSHIARECPTYTQANSYPLNW